MNFWMGGNIIVGATCVFVLILVFAIVHACRKANVYVQHFGEGLVRVMAAGMCAPVRWALLFTIWWTKRWR